MEACVDHRSQSGAAAASRRSRLLNKLSVNQFEDAGGAVERLRQDLQLLCA